MEKKNRRYEIQSNVRIPNMEDIQRAASDFSEVQEEVKHDFVTRNAKNIISKDDKAKYVPKLNEIKEEMVHLAMAVASEEMDKGETDNAAAPSDDIKTVEDESVSSTTVEQDVNKTISKNTSSIPKGK
ncbi:MAG: hypothetical protein WCG21_00115 [Eubacteriales bacterium]